MSHDTLIANARILGPDGLEPADIAIDQGRIAAILPPGSGAPAETVHDARGHIALPGAIDIHVHIRAPAFPERGSVESETRAAAIGGITTVFEMPITKPCCNSAERVASRRDHFARHALVDFALFGAPADLSDAAMTAMAGEGVIAFKIFTTPAPEGRDDEFEGLTQTGEASQLAVLEAVTKTGRIVVVHPESAELLARFEARAGTMDPARAQTHTASRPDICEAIAIAKLLTLNMRARARLHFAHISSAMAVEVLRRFEGTSDFSAETCPHYLFRTVEDVERAGVYAKINPPVRYKADQDALWAALADGTIQFVTTDHAAFSLAEKRAAEGDFPNAPPGSPGLEVLVPSMLDAVAAGRLTLERMVDLVSGNPARRFGLPSKGRLAVGADADLIVVDPEGHTTITAQTLLTHARDVAHLFDGARFRGRVMTTIVGGRIVAHNGAVIGQPGAGRFVAPSPQPHHQAVA